jgi:hypothetical protein
MPRGRYNLASAKVSRKNTKFRNKQTRKQAHFLAEKDRRERIAQVAIAGEVVMEEIDHLQADGVIPVEGDLALEDAHLVLLHAAGRAGDPATLVAQIQRQVQTVRDQLRATGATVRRYTPRELVQVFMSLALLYWATFPAHAPPKDLSMFDVAASHLSTAGMVTGLLSLPHAGTLVGLATGAKIAGHAVRMTNAFTGLHTMTNSNMRRAKLNVLNYAPAPIGTALTFGRLAGIASGAIMDNRRGGSNYTGGLGNVFTATTADVGVKMGKRLGYNEETVLKTLTPSA